MIVMVPFILAFALLFTIAALASEEAKTKYNDSRARRSGNGK